MENALSSWSAIKMENGADPNQIAQVGGPKCLFSRTSWSNLKLGDMLTRNQRRAINIYRSKYNTIYLLLFTLNIHCYTLFDIIQHFKILQHFTTFCGNILVELSQIITYFFLFLCSSLSLWLKSEHPDSCLTWYFYETTVFTCKKQSGCT